MKVLVIQIKHIGDAVVSSMLFQGLKALGDQVETHYMVAGAGKLVVQHNPDIDEFFVVDANRLHSPSYVFSVLKQVKAQRYDAIVDVYGKTIGNLVSWISYASIKVGYNKKRSGWIYTHKIDPKAIAASRSEPESIFHRKAFLDVFGVDTKHLKPHIRLTQEEQSQAQAFLRAAGIEPKDKLFMVGILGSSPKKSYPAEYMAYLLDRIVEQVPDVHLLMNYIPSQKADVEHILSFVQPATRARVHLDLYAESLREFLALVAQCSGLFGNEGGAINMAKALDVPTFAIYSPQIYLDAWSSDDERKAMHPAAHLSMFKPELFPVHKKNAAKQLELYRAFEPKFFSGELLRFIGQCSSSKAD